jgi:hypothetical protein
MTHPGAPTFILGGTLSKDSAVAISARLSRTLHVTFGEDAAADMMTWMQSVDDQRSQMRDLHELAMARIDARFAEGGARIDARFSEVESRLERKIDQRFADTIKWSFLFWCGAMAAMFWKG